VPYVVPKTLKKYNLSTYDVRTIWGFQCYDEDGCDYNYWLFVLFYHTGKIYKHAWI